MQISENLVLGTPIKARDMNQQCAKLKTLEAASHWEGLSTRSGIQNKQTRTRRPISIH